MRNVGKVTLCTVEANGMKHPPKAAGPGGVWLIECEPHAMLRLKRTFAKVNDRHLGKTTLVNSEENCRELNWFLGRFPMEMTEEHRAYMAKASATFDKRALDFHQVLSGTLKPRKFKLALPPRKYQKVGAELALMSRGLLVADDLGLGKSATAICTMVEPGTRPALVVTMTHLQTQWGRELTKFAPELRWHIIEKIKPYDIAAKMRADTIKKSNKRPKVGTAKCPSCVGVGCHHCAFAGRVDKGSDVSKQKAWTDWMESEPPFPDVIIVNYHKLSKWAEVLASKIESVVFDECQELRRRGTYGDRTAKSLAAEHISRSTNYRIGLSATPIYNYGGEMWNILDILQPDSLGSKAEFQREWCSYSYSEDKARITNPKAFGHFVRESGLMIRRTRREVGRELPPLTRIPYHVDSDPKILDEVKDAAAELARIILSQGEAFTAKGQAARELDWKLRQATGLGKAPHVANFVKMLIESEQQVILYGWHHAVYDVWKAALKEYNPVLFTGQESVKQKDRAREAFVAGDARVLIMSLRSGAGLDGLQECCNVGVFGELDWSPGVHEQCLSEDTEVLTRDGFRGVDEVHLGHEVAAFVDGRIVWRPVVKKIDRPLAADERMFVTKTEKIDLCVTGGHRMVVRCGRRTASGVTRSAWEMVDASSLDGASRRYVPVSGREGDIRGVCLTDYELRLIGWFVSDGSFNGRQLQFYQADHQRWNADLRETLNGCRIDWGMCTRPSGMNIYYVPSGRGSRRWSISEVGQMMEMVADGASYGEVARSVDRSPVAVGKRYRRTQGVDEGTLCQRIGRGWDHLEPYLDKDMSPLMEDMTREQLEHFLHGLWMGDGSKSTRLKNVKRITSVNKNMLDRLQSICVRRGMAANISKRKGRTRVGNPIYDIWLSDAEEASLPGPSKPNRIKADPWEPQRVWCVTNDVGTLVVRRGGKVVVVGNCIGRYHRDGQTEGSVAYFLIAEDGSDPVIADILGLKRQQITGIKNPDASLVENLQTDPNHIKKLAEHFLKNRGLHVDVVDS